MGERACSSFSAFPVYSSHLDEQNKEGIVSTPRVSLSAEMWGSVATHLSFEDLKERFEPVCRLFRALAQDIYRLRASQHPDHFALNVKASSVSVPALRRVALMYDRQASDRSVLPAAKTKFSSRAFQAYRETAEKGDALAQCNVGVYYMKGIGVQKSETEALRWFQASHAQGFIPVAHNLGSYYAAQEAWRQAVHYWQQGIDHGDLESSYQIALLHLKGVMPPDEEKGPQTSEDQRVNGFTLLYALAQRGHQDAKLISQFIVAHYVPSFKEARRSSAVSEEKHLSGVIQKLLPRIIELHKDRETFSCFVDDDT